MLRIVRHVLRLVALLAVALYGAAQAVPAAVSGDLIELVICSDGGQKTILIDAKGNPVQDKEEFFNKLKYISFTNGLLPGQVRQAPVPEMIGAGLLLSETNWPVQTRDERPQTRDPPPTPGMNLFRAQIWHLCLALVTLEFDQVTRRQDMAADGQIHEVAR